MMLDMTRGRPLPLMLRFAVPLMLSSILQNLYTLADGAIVGRMLGETAFAAVGAASAPHWFPLSMLMGLSHGFGVVLSQRFGAGDEAGFRRAFASGLLLGAGLSLVLMAAGFGLLGPFLGLLKTPDALMADAAAYLRVMWLGLPLASLYNVTASALRAMGDSRTPFFALVVSSLLNIALDFLLIAAFGMGVGGAALATVLAQGVSLGYCALRLRGASHMPRTADDWRPRAQAMGGLLRMGVPQMLSYGVTSVGEVIVQAAINGHGAIFVAGMVAARRYFPVLNLVGGALEGALAMFVGQNAGAGRQDRVFGATRSAVRFGTALATLTAVVVAVAAGPMIRLFLPGSGEEALRVGTDALRVMVIFLPALYVLCLCRAAIQGLGRPLVPMLSGFLELALRLLCVWLAPIWLGRAGLYYTDAAAWAGTGLMLWVAFYRLSNDKGIVNN